MSAPEPKMTLMEEAFGCIRIVKPDRSGKTARPAPAEIAQPPVSQDPSEKDPPDEELLQALRSLRLLGMVEELKQQSQDPALEGMSFEQRLAYLLEREIDQRARKRQHNKLKKAGLQSYADLDAVYYGPQRGLSQTVMEQVGCCAWIDDGQDMLICGPTGTGKTYLCNAIGRRAVELGHGTAYYRLPQMLRALAEARVTGGFKAAMEELLNLDLLIIDDWGWGSLSRSQRLDLLEIIESRHGRKSTLVASQLEIGQWPEFIGDVRVAESICDRMTNAAQVFSLGGPSLRNQGDVSP